MVILPFGRAGLLLVGPVQCLGSKTWGRCDAGMVLYDKYDLPNGENQEDK
jgi:hypothetical protein